MDGPIVVSGASLVESNPLFGRIEPDLHFDGHVFWQATDAGMLAVIEMAYRARRGDKAAIAVLTAFKIKVMSGNGETCYWPPE